MLLDPALHASIVTKGHCFKLIKSEHEYILISPLAAHDANYKSKCLGANLISSIGSLLSVNCFTLVQVFSSSFSSHIITVLSKEQVAKICPNSG